MFQNGTFQNGMQYVSRSVTYVLQGSILLFVNILQDIMAPWRGRGDSTLEATGMIGQRLETREGLFMLGFL